VYKRTKNISVSGPQNDSCTDHTPNDIIREYKEQKLSTLIWFT